MNKWVASALAIGSAVAVGLIVRQICNDLADNAKMWRSVTDEPELTN